MTIRALKALKVPKVPTNVQKTLRAKELKDKTAGSRKPAQRKEDTKKVVGEARRKAQTADRGDKTQAIAKKVLPEVTKVRKKVEGMTIDQLSIKFTGNELKAMEVKLKQASKPNQALLNKLSKARDQRTGMVEASETPSDRPQKTPAKFRKKGGTVKRKGGGDLKPVDAKKNPGLAKLPTPVRNKMGYAKKGKQVSEAMGEDRTSVPKEFSAKEQAKRKPAPRPKPKPKAPKKFGGKVINGNMSGQDIVAAIYD